MKPFKKKKHTDRTSRGAEGLEGRLAKSVLCFLWAGSHKSFLPEKERTTKTLSNFKLSVFNEKHSALHYPTAPHRLHLSHLNGMKKLTEETHPQLYEKEEFGPTFGHLNQKRNEFKTEMTPQREQTCTAR